LCRRGLFLLQPQHFDFFFEWLEFDVAGDQFGILVFCERSGECIGEADFVASLEVGGEIGETPVGRVKLDGQGRELGFDFFPAGRPVLADDRIPRSCARVRRGRRLFPATWRPVLRRARRAKMR
jgi:hypothetical protein